MGQLVGDLWSDGGLSSTFSHGGGSARSYAFETPDRSPILLKYVVSEVDKFVIANFHKPATSQKKFLDDPQMRGLLPKKRPQTRLPGGAT